MKKCCGKCKSSANGCSNLNCPCHSTSDNKETEWEVESLSAKLHNVYMSESLRQRDIRYEQVYDKLPENVKEYDRVLARYIITQLKEAEERGRELNRGREAHQEAFREGRQAGKEATEFELKNLQEMTAYQEGAEAMRKAAIGWCSLNCDGETISCSVGLENLSLDTPKDMI